jgi:hypothetical protein
MYKEMRNTLQWTLMRSKDKQVVIDGQRQWQKQKRDACTDGLCLAEAYLLRTKELLAISDRPSECYVPHPILDSDGKVKPIEPVCQAMEENLNRFCDQPPMVCELKVAPECRQQITFPNWTPLDPEKNRELIEEFLRTPWRAGSSQPNSTLKKEIFQEEKTKINEAITAKTLTFAKDTLDLYNMGQPQTAYRLDYGTCYAANSEIDDPKHWNRPLIAAPVKIQLAPEIVRPLFEEFFPIDRAPASEVFGYGGQTFSYYMFGYIDKRGGGIENWLDIFRHEQWLNPIGHVVRLNRGWVCRFQYKGKEVVK